VRALWFLERPVLCGRSRQVLSATNDVCGGYLSIVIRPTVLAGLELLQLMERFRPPPSARSYHWPRSDAIWGVLHKVPNGSLLRDDNMCRVLRTS
jgi:hypothetical protein